MLNFFLINISFCSKKETTKKKLLLSFLLFIASFGINAQKIYYTHQNTSLEEIIKPETQWSKYTYPIYKGRDNGIYWFKIELQKTVPQILNIPESHISRANLFYNNQEIESEKDTRYVTFKIENQNNTKKTYYLKVNCLLEAKIPLKIENYSDFYKEEMKEYLVIGLYIGIVSFIILFNLLTYLTLKDNIYLFYVLMTIGMSINAFYKDGLTALIFGIHGVNEKHELTLTSIVVVSSIFFGSKYLSLNEYLPKVKKLAIIIVSLSFFTNFLFQITANFSFFIITNICYLATIDVFLVAGVLLWKKSEYARIFTIAYFFQVVFVHDYYMASHLGIHFLGLSLDFYKIGSVFEMIVFTCTLIYQSKMISEENKTIRIKLIEFTNKLKEQNLDINKSNTTTSEELIEQFGFTISEIKVLKQVANKKTNKEIASLLFISENTVKFHVRNILQKLEVKNRKEAANKYLKSLDT